MPTSLSIVKKFFPEVEHISDATKNLRVEVTRKDSNSSAVKNHKGCAMAVACKRTFGVQGVLISRDRAYLIKDNRATRYSLNNSVSREVVSFDRGAGFAEGVYELSKPPKVEVKTGKPKGKSHGNGPDYKGPRFVHQTTGIRESLLDKNTAA
jgi:hypothetical protein